MKTMKQQLILKQTVFFILMTMLFSSATFAQWSTSGNAISNGDFLGSTNSFPLIFKTNGGARMYITETGYVGIGTTTPAQMLDVNGNVNVNGNLTANCISSACLNIAGSLSIDHATILRILSPEGVVHFGDSSLSLDYAHNIIAQTNASDFLNTGVVKGIRIGRVSGSGNNLKNAQLAYGSGSVAMGFYAGTGANATNSICMGSGSLTESLALVNNDPNSLWVGFNTTIPTLFVGPANGSGTVGNVGIGTTTPKSAFNTPTLQSNGSISINAKINNGANYNGNTSLFFGQEYTAGGTAAKWGIQYVPSAGNPGAINSTSQGGLNFWVPYDPIDGNYVDNAYLFIADGKAKTVNGTNVITAGYVGIGTADPSYKLDVNGNVNAKGFYLNGSPFAQQWVNSTVNTNDIYYAAGNVGIGTANAVAKLTLNGDFAIVDNNGTTNFRIYSNGGKSGYVRARDVVIDAQPITPDYVFEKNYALRSLAEVEAYVTTNKHLPNIPSAKEFDTKGITVGDLQMKLLEKVEELTLYVIELKKENEAIKAQMESMNK